MQPVSRNLHFAILGIHRAVHVHGDLRRGFTAQQLHERFGSITQLLTAHVVQHEVDLVSLCLVELQDEAGDQLISSIGMQEREAFIGSRSGILLPGSSRRAVLIHDALADDSQAPMSGHSLVWFLRLDRREQVLFDHVDELIGNSLQVLRQVTEIFEAHVPVRQVRRELGKAVEHAVGVEKMHGHALGHAEADCETRAHVIYAFIRQWRAAESDGEVLLVSVDDGLAEWV